MFQSLRHSQASIRIGLVLVFLWLGISSFIMPKESLEISYLFGIFEVLVATSLATGFFIRSFAVAGILLLGITTLGSGLNDASIRDVGLIGALISLIIWPERTY